MPAVERRDCVALHGDGGVSGRIFRVGWASHPPVMASRHHELFPRLKVRRGETPQPAGGTPTLPGNPSQALWRRGGDWRAFGGGCGARGWACAEIRHGSGLREGQLQRLIVWAVDDESSVEAVGGGEPHSVRRGGADAQRVCFFVVSGEGGDERRLVEAVLGFRRADPADGVQMR